MADIRDVVGRILAQLALQTAPDRSDVDEPVILVAPEILPSQALTFDRLHVAGILTETGGATGHAAILARSLGIPAVSGLRGILPRGPDRRPDRPGRPGGPRLPQPRARGRGGLPQAAARVRRPARPADREPRPGAGHAPTASASSCWPTSTARPTPPWPVQAGASRRRPVPHRVPVPDPPDRARRGGAAGRLPRGDRGGPEPDA